MWTIMKRNIPQCNPIPDVEKALAVVGILVQCPLNYVLEVGAPEPFDNS